MELILLDNSLTGCSYIDPTGKTIRMMGIEDKNTGSYYQNDEAIKSLGGRYALEIIENEIYISILGGRFKIDIKEKDEKGVKSFNLLESGEPKYKFSRVAS